jgi:predicted O-methyltransferase YrrM
MITHPETFMAIDRLGDVYPPFRPTYAESPAEGYLSPYQQRLAAAPTQQGLLMRLRDRGVRRRAERLRTADTLVDLRNALRFRGVTPGWLMHADALKLYEMAYHAAGPILELGCYHGLSTSIMAHAVRDASHATRIYSVDLDPVCIASTLRTLRRRNLALGCALICDEAANATLRFAAEGLRFAFAFVDHAHTYAPVRSVCEALPEVMQPGGYCLFHDFNSPFNRDPNNRHYQVYQAVMDGLDPQRFRFCGVYGCTGLYRFTG